jgi:hypothetical protein
MFLRKILLPARVFRLIAGYPSGKKNHLVSRKIKVNNLVSSWFHTVLWICTGFNSNLNPDFYINAYPDPDPGSQTSP